MQEQAEEAGEEEAARMPLTRYRIKNEYGLADPEMYRSADKDDPEALLEGVAMAGLVGLLRQLGDLAESVPLSSSLYALLVLLCRDSSCGSPRLCSEACWVLTPNTRLTA